MSETPPEDEDSEGELPPRTHRTAVRDRYARIGESGPTTGTSITPTDGTPDGHSVGDGTATADGETECCGDTAADTECCEGESTDARAKTLGYTTDDLSLAPEGANLGLGCGNPQAIADLREGETVCDLGAGGGFDCFLAAEAVGDEGRVIGVDMTPEMVERARANADRQDTDVVEFRLGEIEHLPVADGQVDVVMSNCVINLSPAKQQVFEEAYRVLAPGGRLAISDIVRTRDAGELDRSDPDLVSGCIAGAASVESLTAALETAGFEGVSIRPSENSDAVVEGLDPETDRTADLMAAIIRGEKPEG